MGSTSSLTPRFSMQVSPSWICSSNSKPYCSPEQPPPCTNTRSMSFGFPSPRMRSPTLRAAASVKLSAGASCNASIVLIIRSEEHTSELQSRLHLVCRLLLETKIHGAAQCAALIGLFGGGKIALVPGRRFNAKAECLLIQTKGVNTRTLFSDAMRRHIVEALP